MKSLTVLVCVFGLGLTRPSAQNFGNIRAGGASLRSAPPRPGPALIARPLNSVLAGRPVFRSRGFSSRAFSGPGGVISSSGGLVSSSGVGGAQPSLPLTGRVTRPSLVSSPGLVTGARVVSSPGPLAPQSARFVSSGPARVVSSPSLNRVVSSPGLNRVVSSTGLNRPVSNPGLNRAVSSPGFNRAVSSPDLNRVVSSPGLGVATGPLVSPVPVSKVVSTVPVAAVVPAVVQTGPVSVAGPAFTATAHPAAHNLGPAHHHSSHGAIAEPAQSVQHNTVHNSISSSPSIVHSTELHHGVHEGGHDGGYDEKPDPFHFEYGVHDDKYYTDFSEQRSGDEYGNIVGEYQVALPDGRIQYVTYRADGNYGGTTMEVSYTGEARHPEHSGNNLILESSPI